MLKSATSYRPCRRTLLLAATAALGLAAAGPAEAELAAGAVYKIGWASDKSNYLSFVDEPLAKGMEVAIEEINAAGGIGGKVKIELDRRDMKSDPMLGATVAVGMAHGTLPSRRAASSSAKVALMLPRNRVNAERASSRALTAFGS